mmetsp:Transcript_23515/g.50036  ORF Transcript_23515/g.50036 Transcript_23515/m.50036 type:complete len:621 (+) Transcript_23515:131-1993(+)|eukprot:CAMPEP_0201116626 /NCGR_PEP_ID=MMETSP0850-20130426/833_1 /ASSEMBLY_ACC=CAM_ASM_000622 /TAXON_ID=183588 /ORGANISM="Pseudo-nitzschia fraudulenta, Strain WWA7" /LENGTH=620 /DNA_ID=CAMNT_0047380739 /DNA_START=66 /DNA_END=1928 /DNA_ORIENTATION=+
MFRNPQSIFRQLWSEEDGVANEKRRGLDSKEQNVFEIETETGARASGQEIVRNRSNETHSTLNSSGIFSLDLLMEIYPSISESESEHGETNEVENDIDTVVHENLFTENKKGDDGDEVSNENPSLSFFNNVVPTRHKSSCWVEGRPFDEESLRAISELISERGEYLQNAYSKDFDNVEEYFLPPVASPGNYAGKHADEEPFDVVKKSSMNTTSTASEAHNEIGLEARNRSFGSSSEDNNDERARKRCGTSIKHCLIVFIVTIILMGGAIFLGLEVSKNRNDSNGSSHHPAAASSDLAELSTDGKSEGSPTNSDSSANNIAQEVASIGDNNLLPSSSSESAANSTSNEFVIQNPSLDTTAPSTDSAILPISSVESSTNSTIVEVQIPTTTDNLALSPSKESTSSPLALNDNTQQPTDERPWGTLINYVDPVPEDFFPLGLCVGDCDRDADCAEGLVCFQRGANDPVPFCYGGENDFTRTDYCTYPSFEDSAVESVEECLNDVFVYEDCFFRTENVIVVSFENCSPLSEDWVGVYPDGTAFDERGSVLGWMGEDYIDWAFTCGDVQCDDSPPTFSFAFPTDDNSAYESLSLRAFLLRNTIDGPPYEVIAKSESFAVTNLCEL